VSGRARWAVYCWEASYYPEKREVREMKSGCEGEGESRKREQRRELTFIVFRLQ